MGKSEGKRIQFSDIDLCDRTDDYHSLSNENNTKESNLDDENNNGCYFQDFLGGRNSRM